MNGRGPEDNAVPHAWPRFDELGADGATPPGSSWGVFGDDDQRGTINFLTADRVHAATTLVRHGAVYGLDYPINHFTPYWSGTREAARHHVFSNSDNHHDDYLDGFYLQATTQVDGLRHIGDPQHGFYGGRTRAELAPDGPAIGIQNWSESGIVGRGVLLDVERHFRETGRFLDPRSTYGITTDDLEDTAGAHGVELRGGDILLVRTGWAGHYLELDHAGRERFNADFRSPGLAHTVDVVRWLWDHQVAVVAADNVGVEAFPVPGPRSDYYVESEERAPRGPDHRGMLHRPLIALLGMALGELWNLDPLAEACAADRTYDFLVTCKPLHLIGGVGSPANAIAIR
ncbi:cyclase family protein [Pseudonocardia ailaonensis]|uniref:Cyclase family protein n=1 Tax=Pseudonocardia ailaonensis TaxID=367279 RepID=A0ABN2NE68_9PSEU